MSPIIGLLVATYFALVPQTVSAKNSIPSELICIVQHESGGNQFTANGDPLVSPTNDVGVMQLHIPSWLSLSKKMGLDIVNNAEDNIKFGIWLYDKEGGGPWTTDRFCKGADDS